MQQPRASCSHLCASVTKQHNLVVGTGQRTVTFFGWESDRRSGGKQWQPTKGDDLKSHCGMTTCTPRSAPGPIFGNEYGRTLPFLLVGLRVQRNLSTLSEGRFTEVREMRGLIIGYVDIRNSLRIRIGSDINKKAAYLTRAERCAIKSSLLMVNTIYLACLNASSCQTGIHILNATLRRLAQLSMWIEFAEFTVHGHGHHQ